MPNNKYMEYYGAAPGSKRKARKAPQSLMIRKKARELGPEGPKQSKPRSSKTGSHSSVNRTNFASTFSKKTVKKMGAEGPKRRSSPKPAKGLQKAMKNTQRGRKAWN